MWNINNFVDSRIDSSADSAREYSLNPIRRNRRRGSPRVSARGKKYRVKRACAQSQYVPRRTITFTETGHTRICYYTIPRRTGDIAEIRTAEYFRRLTVLLSRKITSRKCYGYLQKKKKKNNSHGRSYFVFEFFYFRKKFDNILLFRFCRLSRINATIYGPQVT